MVSSRKGTYSAAVGGLDEGDNLFLRSYIEAAKQRRKRKNFSEFADSATNNLDHFCPDCYILTHICFTCVLRDDAEPYHEFIVYHSRHHM